MTLVLAFHVLLSIQQHGPVCGVHPMTQARVYQRAAERIERYQESMNGDQAALQQDVSDLLDASDACELYGIQLNLCFLTKG